MIRLGRRTKLIFLVFLLLALLYGPRLAKIVYPWPYRETIKTQAAAHDLDPWLVAAVVNAESGFNPAASSHRGALGLMQVMPETGAWVAQQAGLSDPAQLDLTDPEINVAIGTWYLAHLLAEFREVPVALAAYNAGRGRVGQWLEREGAPEPTRDFGPGEETAPDGEADYLAWIAFPETRAFVAKVLRDQKIYRFLYPDP